MQTLSVPLQKAQSLLVGTLFPPRCASCHETVTRHGALCAKCWGNMHFITEPFCLRCGLPFEYHLGMDAICGVCLRSPPAFAQARSVLRYDASSRQTVRAFKYHDKTQLAPVFAPWLARAGEQFLSRVEWIIPVPLHWKRLLLRRYNQAALLAYALSHVCGLPVLPDIVLRKKSTPPQAGLTRKGRENNMRGAFMVRENMRAALKSKSVLLIDDVMTTGTTLNACARVLHDAGVVDVYAVTLARTVLGE